MPNTFGWWLFSAIVSGFLFSLLATYASRRIDAFTGKFSEKKRLANEAERKKVESYAKKVQASS
jgi:hypothetical protein